MGDVSAGSAPNAIPDGGRLSGTLRMLDGPRLANQLSDIVAELAEQVVAPTGATIKVDYAQRGAGGDQRRQHGRRSRRQAAVAAVSARGGVRHPAVLGGEDFAWYLQRVPGAMARLGVRTPGARPAADLHPPDFDLDERAIGTGVRVLASTAVFASSTAAAGA